MTGNYIYHRYNGRYDWEDFIAWRGDSRSERTRKKQRKAYALHAKRKERSAAKNAIRNEIDKI